jgi:inorganic pyrophosphatase
MDIGKEQNNSQTSITEVKKPNIRNLVAKNPWHFVSPGENAPRIVRALIEIPTGCKAKYELDKESGLIKLDRVLFSAVHYPANYGFIPMTYGEDHDPLDILVLCSVELEILCLVEAKVIGVMRMRDQG